MIILIKSIEDFGRYIEDIAETNPNKARRMLLLGYRAYGFKLKYFPDKRLPHAKQKSAVYLNHTIRKALTEPDNVVLVNIFMPCEVLEAMDIVPMCAELFSGFINGTYSERVFLEEAEKEGISDTYCSFHKTVLGASYLKVLEQPKAIINTSFVCDANNLTFRELARVFDAPHYYVEVPSEMSEESVEYVAGELREATKLLEDTTGKKLDEEKLKKVMERSKENEKLFKKILHEKRTKYLPTDVTSELYETYLMHNALGSEMTMDYAKTFLNDFKTAKKFSGIKILWMHIIPNWQKPVTDIFNFNDKCQIITCDMNFDSLIDIDVDKPYESMATRLVYNNWNSGERRVKKALEMAKELNVDGAVCFCQWGCKQTMGISGIFKETFEENSIPMLVLDGDCVDRRNAFDGQVSTRLNAFVEMLEKKNAR